MRFTNFGLTTLKEIPAEAEIVSHQLMLRAGLIRRLASGLFTWMPLGLRVLRKVEKILAELNVQPVQVTIEAKFVEISQKDLEELGFQWLFTGDADTGGSKELDFIGVIPWG